MHTVKIPSALSLKLLSPSPYRVEDETHAHSTLHFQLQGAVRVLAPIMRLPGPSSAAPPQLGQHLGKPAGKIVSLYANQPDGADGIGEQSSAVFEIDVV